MTAHYVAFKQFALSEDAAFTAVGRPLANAGESVMSCGRPPQLDFLKAFSFFSAESHNGPQVAAWVLPWSIKPTKGCHLGPTFQFYNFL